MNYGPIYPWIRISFQIKNYILIFLIQDLTVQPYLAMKSEIQPAPAGIKFILLWEVKSTVKNHGKKKKNELASHPASQFKGRAWVSLVDNKKWTVTVHDWIKRNFNKVYFFKEYRIMHFIMVLHTCIDTFFRYIEATIWQFSGYSWHDLSSISKTYMMGGGYQFPQVVLWPPHSAWNSPQTQQ